MASSVNTYSNLSKLDDKVTLQRSQVIKNQTSLNLYSALMMTKEDNEKRKSKNNNLVKDLLTSNGAEQLSESDKEAILYTLDYLRIKGIKEDIFKKFTKEDFAKIKNHKTASYKAQELTQIIIEKSGENLGLSDKDKQQFTEDVNSYVTSLTSGKNAEVGNDIAETMALTKITTNRFRHFGARIRKLIKDNNGDISKCYMDVIKLSNYASLSLGKRVLKRHIVPIKFEKRNIHKQTEKTLNALVKESEGSNSQTEKLAINYIIKKLRDAYNAYKETIGISNKAFDKAQADNERRIYAAAA